MPKKPKLNSEWEKRILEFVAGKSFGQGQRRGKTTKWGKVFERIEKCPMRTFRERGKAVMGRLRVCECGYHASFRILTKKNKILLVMKIFVHSLRSVIKEQHKLKKWWTLTWRTWSSTGSRLWTWGKVTSRSRTRAHDVIESTCRHSRRKSSC
jgi:hypothetical protein